jgi:glutamate racemase
VHAGPVGVFDSGLGGLSVLQALRAELPQQDFIYIADSGHAPYGERDAAHVMARSRALTAWLLDQRVQALVVACNTATAAAIDVLRTEHPDLPIIGVEPALKPAAALSKTKRIGVMATRGTLASKRFRALLANLSSQAEFVLQPCDGLAEAIEQAAGQPSDAPELIAACARHTGAMGRFGLKTGDMDTLVLGCTHYPFATGALRTLLGTEVQFLDTGAPVARQTRLRLPAAATDGSPPGTGQLRLFSTGQPLALQSAAQRWLSLDIPATRLSL